MTSRDAKHHPVTIAVWSWRIFVYWQGVRFHKLRSSIYQILNWNHKAPPTRLEIAAANRIGRERARREALRRGYEDWLAIETERQSEAHAEAGQREHYEIIASQVLPGWVIMPIYQTARDASGRVTSHDTGFYDIKAPDGCRATLDGERHIIDGEGWTVSHFWNGVYREYTITSPAGAVASMSDFFDA